MKIEYFFDFSCPYAYLGATQVEAHAARYQAQLVWKPFLLGGVFRALDQSMNLAIGQVPAKAAHGTADMMRWAKRCGVPLKMPVDHPISTLRALRALLASPQEHWAAVIRKSFDAYWVHDQDISAPQVVEQILRSAGLAPDALSSAMAANESEAVKQELRTRTDEALERGVFGAPTLFVSGAHLKEPVMLWGQDRFNHSAALLQGWSPEGAPPSVETPAKISSEASESQAVTREKQIDFWYDFSSPFAYLGAMRIAALAKRAGATLRWRTMLLGALFKSQGSANVPLFVMSPAKREYMAHELRRWAAFTQQPFQFATPFPIRSVTALRLALLAEDRIGELTTLLFRAAWSEQRDISDPKALVEILDQNGFDGAQMLDACGSKAVKDQLRENTAEAEARGVFGVPTSIITVDGESQLYWGQDRLLLVEEALR